MREGPPQSVVALPVRATSNASSSPMPAHQRLGTDDREHLQDRWKPPIQLDEKPAIAVRAQDPAPHLAPQNVQLMSECQVLCASSRLFDLNGAATTVRTKQSNANIVR